jgi:hypothetical protein
MEDYVTQKQIVKATGWSQPTISRRIAEMKGLIKKTFGNVTVYHIESLPKEMQEILKAKQPTQ